MTAEQKQAYQKDYYQKNRQRLLEYRSRYARDNKELVNAANRSYRRSNPERVRAAGRIAKKRFYYNHRTSELERRRAYIRNNRDKVNAYNMEVYWRNPEKGRAKNRASGKRFYQLHISEERARSIEKQAWREQMIRETPIEERRQIRLMIEDAKQDQSLRCCYCDTQIYGTEFHVEHVHPLSRGGRHEVSNIAFSCAFCNVSKGDKLLEEWRAN